MKASIRPWAVFLSLSLIVASNAFAQSRGRRYPAGQPYRQNVSGTPFVLTLSTCDDEDLTSAFTALKDSLNIKQVSVTLPGKTGTGCKIIFGNPGKDRDIIESALEDQGIKKYKLQPCSGSLCSNFSGGACRSDSSGSSLNRNRRQNQTTNKEQNQTPIQSLRKFPQEVVDRAEDSVKDTVLDWMGLDNDDDRRDTRRTDQESESEE